jgi:hypothetical protein
MDKCYGLGGGAQPKPIASLHPKADMKLNDEGWIIEKAGAFAPAFVS